jgi:hypothetical protein
MKHSRPQVPSASSATERSRLVLARPLHPGCSHSELLVASDSMVVLQSPRFGHHWTQQVLGSPKHLPPSFAGKRLQACCQMTAERPSQRQLSAARNSVERAWMLCARLSWCTRPAKQSPETCSNSPSIIALFSESYFLLHPCLSKNLARSRQGLPYSLGKLCPARLCNRSLL